MSAVAEKEIHEEEHSKDGGLAAKVDSAAHNSWANIAEMLLVRDAVKSNEEFVKTFSAAKPAAQLLKDHAGQDEVATSGDPAIRTVITDTLDGNAATKETQESVPCTSQESDAKLATARTSIDTLSDSDTTEGRSDAEADNSCSETGSSAPPSEAGGEENGAYKDARRESRMFHVHAALPHDITFKAPKGCSPGQMLSVKGPHGPLMVQMPKGVKPGKRITVRLAAPHMHEVFVPVGANPGDKVIFLDENDNEVEAIVPKGKKPGQVFHVSPPVVLVPIPAGSLAGDQLSFTVPDRSNGPGKYKACIASVPPSMGPGQYITVKY